MLVVVDDDDDDSVDGNYFLEFSKILAQVLCVLHLAGDGSGRR